MLASSVGLLDRKDLIVDLREQTLKNRTGVLGEIKMIDHPPDVVTLFLQFFQRLGHNFSLQPSNSAMEANYPRLPEAKEVTTGCGFSPLFQKHKSSSLDDISSSLSYMVTEKDVRGLSS